MCIESFHRSEELRPEAKNFKTFFVHTVNIFNLPDIYSVLIFSISNIDIKNCAHEVNRSFQLLIESKTSCAAKIYSNAYSIEL